MSSTLLIGHYLSNCYFIVHSLFIVHSMNNLSWKNKLFFWMNKLFIEWTTEWTTNSPKNYQLFIKGTTCYFNEQPLFIVLSETVVHSMNYGPEHWKEAKFLSWGNLPIWSQMGWMVSKGPRWSQMFTDCPKCSQILLNEPKGSQIILNDLIWLRFSRPMNNCEFEYFCNVVYMRSLGRGLAGHTSVPPAEGEVETWRTGEAPTRIPQCRVGCMCRRVRAGRPTG